MSEHHDIYIVGVNITKLEASLIARNTSKIIRVAHGVYFKTGAHAEKIFSEYGLRLTNYFFKNAILRYSTAWYKRPHEGRIFIGGDYPYKKIIAADQSDFCIIQNKNHSSVIDDRLCEMIEIQDGLGAKYKFRMLCSTPELALLEVMEARKTSIEKRLDGVELDKMLHFLINKHGSKADLLTYLEEISAIADRHSELERLITHLFGKRKK